MFITEKLTEYTSKIKLKIDQNFHDFDKLLNEEKNTIDWIEGQQTSLSDDIDRLENTIEEKFKNLIPIVITDHD